MVVGLLLLVVGFLSYQLYAPNNYSVVSNVEKLLSKSTMSKFLGVYWTQLLFITLISVPVIYIVFYDISNYYFSDIRVNENELGLEPMEISDEETTHDDETTHDETTHDDKLNDETTHDDKLNNWNDSVTSEIEENKCSETSNQFVRTQSLNDWYVAQNYYNTPNYSPEY